MLFSSSRAAPHSSNGSISVTFLFFGFRDNVSMLLWPGSLVYYASLAIIPKIFSQMKSYILSDSKLTKREGFISLYLKSSYNDTHRDSAQPGSGSDQLNRRIQEMVANQQHRQQTNQLDVDGTQSSTCTQVVWIFFWLVVIYYYATELNA